MQVVGNLSREGSKGEAEKTTAKAYLSPNIWFALARLAAGTSLYEQSWKKGSLEEITLISHIKYTFQKL